MGGTTKRGGGGGGGNQIFKVQWGRWEETKRGGMIFDLKLVG